MEKVVKYWKEEEGYESIHNDNAFCAYNCIGKEFFIAHFYIENRLYGKAKEFVQEVTNKAKAIGATHMTCNVYISEDKERDTKKLVAFIRHGFKVESSDDGRITLLRQL